MSATHQLRDWSPYIPFVVVVLGIYVSYVCLGLAQEALQTRQADGRVFNGSAFLLFATCLSNALVALAGIALLSRPQIMAPSLSAPSLSGLSWWRASFSDPTMFCTSLVYVLAMWTSNEALKYVSFPFMVLVKSCKMVPILLGTILVLRASYPLAKYVCVVMMSAGIAWFHFGGVSAQASPSASKISVVGEAAALATADSPPRDSMWGGLLLLSSLALDGLAGPLQEWLGKRLASSIAAAAAMPPASGGPAASETDCSSTGSIAVQVGGLGKESDGTNDSSSPANPSEGEGEKDPLIGDDIQLQATQQQQQHARARGPNSTPSSSASSPPFVPLPSSLRVGAAGAHVSGLAHPHRQYIDILEQMMVCNLWAAAIMFALMFSLGEVKSCSAFLASYPRLFVAFGAFCLTSGVGQLFIFYGLRTLGALNVAGITATRKFFTVLASIVIFHHTLSISQWCATVLVFFAIGIEAATSSKAPHGGGKDEKRKDELPTAHRSP